MRREQREEEKRNARGFMGEGSGHTLAGRRAVAAICSTVRPGETGGRPRSSDEVHRTVNRASSRRSLAAVDPAVPAQVGGVGPLHLVKILFGPDLEQRSLRNLVCKRTSEFEPGSPSARCLSRITIHHAVVVLKRMMPPARQIPRNTSSDGGEDEQSLARSRRWSRDRPRAPRGPRRYAAAGWDRRSAGSAFNVSVSIG